METIRTFIASPVVIPVTLNERLGNVMYELNRAGWRVKWVDPEQLHLTYRFLGETDSKLVRGISDSLGRSLSEMQKISTKISGIGSFGPVRSPRVIWMGLENSGDFSRIKSRIDEVLSEFISLQDERSFKPHLTIGRVKQPGDPDLLQRIIAERDSYPDEALEIDRIIFFRRVLQQKGPVYSPLQTFYLK